MGFYTRDLGFARAMQPSLGWKVRGFTAKSMCSLGRSQLPKLHTRVRFPSPAPAYAAPQLRLVCARTTFFDAQLRRLFSAARSGGLGAKLIFKLSVVAR